MTEIGAVNTIKTSNITENTAVKNAQADAEIQIFENQRNKAKKTIIKTTATSNFLSQVNENIALDYIQTEIVKTEKGTMLRIKRQADDPYDIKKRNESCLGTLKNKLGINDYVIAKYNDSRKSTDRPVWSDNATIEPGAYIDVPVTELGQRKLDFFDKIFTSKPNTYTKLKNLASKVK